MIYRKQRLCAAMSLIMVGIFAVLAGCGKEEKQEDITLNIKVNASLAMTAYADSEVHSGYDFLLKAADDFAKRYDKANVKVQVIEVPSMDEEEEITNVLGTPEGPDVLLKEYFNMSTYIHSGTVIPLDDIITDSIKEDIAEEYWNLGKFGGKNYMMPFLGMQNVLAYNKELFRQAGLNKYISDERVVQSWTLEEWDEILAALRGSLPDTAYPMMMYAADNQGDTHIMTLLRSRGCKLFDEYGRFCVNCKEGVAALNWINECNKKGYFPTRSENMAILDNQSLFMNNQLAIELINSNLEVFAEEAGIDYGLVNFPSEDGVGYNTVFLTGFQVFDNGDAAKIAVAKDFVKYIYESDWLDYSAGSIPVSKRVASKYAEQLAEMKPYIENTGRTVDITGNNPNWIGVRAVFYQDMQSFLFGDTTPEETAARMDEHCNKAIEEGYAESVIYGGREK